MGITWSADDKDATGTHGMSSASIWASAMRRFARSLHRGHRPNGKGCVHRPKRARKPFSTRPGDAMGDATARGDQGREVEDSSSRAAPCPSPRRRTGVGDAAVTRSWPLALMRYFAPDVVQDRRLLGAQGVILGSMKHFSHRSRRVPHSPAHDVGHVSRLDIVWMMANEVTRRSMVYFICESEGQFVIPGLEEWADGFDFTDSFGRGRASTDSGPVRRE